MAARPPPRELVVRLHGPALLFQTNELEKTMARKKVENAKPDDGQTEIGGTEHERPAVAGVRFSLSEAKATLKHLRILGEMQDDEGRLLRVESRFHIELESGEVELLPEVAPAVAALVELGTELPSKAKNTFAVSIGREFAGARYTISGKPGRVRFNGQVKGSPKVSVTKGKASLVLTLVGVLREANVQVFTRYLSEKPKLSVEPPQQELDFVEAA